MKMFYSASEGGFYDDFFTPPDAVELTDEEYEELYVAINQGDTLTVVGGKVLVTPKADQIPAPAG